MLLLLLLMSNLPRFDHQEALQTGFCVFLPKPHHFKHFLTFWHNRLILYFSGSSPATRLSSGNSATIQALDTRHAHGSWGAAASRPLRGTEPGNACAYMTESVSVSTYVHHHLLLQSDTSGFILVFSFSLFVSLLQKRETWFSPFPPTPVQMPSCSGLGSKSLLGHPHVHVL